jgi:hypothetical protein
MSKALRAEHIRAGGAPKDEGILEIVGKHDEVALPTAIRREGDSR